MINTKSLTNFIKDNCLEDVPCQTEFNDQLVWSVFLDEEHLQEIEYSYYFNEELTIKYLHWSPDSNDCRCKATDLTPIGALIYRINNTDSTKETCDIAEALYKYYDKYYDKHDDVISREAVFEVIDDCNSDGLKGIFCSYDAGERFKGYVKDLPPANPQTSETITEDVLFKLIRNYYGIKKEDCCFISVHDLHQPETPKYIATDWGRKKVIRGN